MLPGARMSLEEKSVAIPQVAIVGRPNVGKSSLFNWLAGRRIAIVDPTAGVTRDRVSALVRAEGRFFELIDTGGIGAAGQGGRPPAALRQQADRLRGQQVRYGRLRFPGGGVLQIRSR